MSAVTDMAHIQSVEGELNYLAPESTILRFRTIAYFE